MVKVISYVFPAALIVKLPNYVWKYLPDKTVRARRLMRSLGIPWLVARVLANRHHPSPEQARPFLNPSLADLHDPNELKDIDRAIERITQAYEKREKICIYGDYDADGITATALLMRFFSWLGLEVSFYIPHRISEGYGLNLQAIQQIIDAGFTLLITVDTGISGHQEVEFAQNHGLDVIVTDHHQASELLPPAIAVINPSRPDCSYPFDSLAGVGVAFKLIYALCMATKKDKDRIRNFLYKHLDLVALGTIADIVPLTGENRILVKYGLEVMKNTGHPGLKALIKSAGMTRKDFGTNEVAFWLAPRLNAAGRTRHASLGVDLLLENDEEKASKLARHLSRLNEKRQQLESQIITECLPCAAKKLKKKPMVLVLSGEEWHRGVIGIVASKLMDKYNRPTIILSLDGDYAIGSARSVDGCDIFKALHQWRQHLISYGGHPRAAGLKIHRDNLEQFDQAINQWAQEHWSKAALQPKLTIDTEVDVEELTVVNIEGLNSLEPFGEENEPPLVSLSEVYLLEPPKVVGNGHLKLLVCDKGKSFPAIGFSMSDFHEELQEWTRPLKIAFTPYINAWRGRKTVELKIRDIKVG